MSDDKLNIEIDGQAFEAKRGEMIIEVADKAGIRIPRFCYHNKLSVAANCRMCLVEVERAPKPMPACATPVMPDMKVSTRSPLALKAQKAVMEFLLINHPLDCPICDQGGECELQDVAMGYGRDISRFTERKRVVPDQNLGPLIATDMTRCIHCTRCVRFSEEVAGLPQLGATGRGENIKIGTYIEQSVDSEMSGNVIDLCPVGALTSKPFRFKARAWEMQQHDAVSPHDSVGSNLYLHVRRNRVMRVVPRENESINEVWISDRDRFSYEGLYSEDRLLAPAIKRDGEWHEVEWDEALAHATSGIKAANAGDVGFLASPSATTEELYLFQKIARGLGSGNVDHRLRDGDFRDEAQAPIFPSLGMDLEALESADAVLLVGANPRKEHPIINHRLRKAENAGARIMAINAMDYDLNYRLYATVLVGPAEFAGSLGRVTGAGSASDGEQTIRAVLEGAENAVILLGPAVAGHHDGAAMRAAAGELAKATNATLGQLSLGANAAGAWLAGAVPHRGAGNKSPSSSGRNAGDMLASGCKVFVTLGVEPELDSQDGSSASQAMANAQFVVALSGYRTAAMEGYADVMLPLAQFAETAGTYVNMAGRWQSFTGAVTPLGDARPGWRVLRVLGNLLDLNGFEYMDCAEVLADVKSVAGQASPETGAWSEANGVRAGARPALERVGTIPLYGVDAITRRARALQQTQDAVFSGVGLSGVTAAQIGLSAGDKAEVRQNGSCLTVEVTIDDRIAEGCVVLPSAIGATAGFGPGFGAIEVEPGGGGGWEGAGIGQLPDSPEGRSFCPPGGQLG